MKPFKFGQLMKHLVRAKQKKPDLPEVFRASEAQIPEKTLTRDMFKEAQERFKNAKAGGGMLVQPGFGGVRQGYAKDNVGGKVGAKEVKDFKTNINNWTKNWIKENINNYNIRESNKFINDLKKAWAKESKNKKYKVVGVDSAKGRVLTQNGFPAVSTNKAVNSFNIFGYEMPGGIKTKNMGNAQRNLYSKIFFTNTLKNDAALRKKLNFYFDYMTADKRGTNASSLSKKVTNIMAKAGVTDPKELLDKDVMYLLSKDSGMGDKARYEFFVNNYGNKYINYRNKVDSMHGDYIKNVRILKDKFNINVKSQLTKENNALKKIFNVDDLPFELRYSGDHLFGVSQAAKSNNKKFAIQAVNNLVGMTREQNKILGLGEFEKTRKNLINKINTAKVGDKTKFLTELNNLMKGTYQDFFGKKQNYYDLDKGKVTISKNFVPLSQEERFANYFKQIDKTKEGRAAIKKQYGNLTNLVASLGGGKCGTKGLLNQGGRVGLQDGTPSVDVCFKNGLERIKKGGVDFTRAEAINFDKLTKGLRAVGASNVIKFGVLPEVLLEGALVADKMASEGDTFAQALRNSYLAVPFQAMGVAKTYEEGEKDRILAAAPESQKGRILDAFSMQDKLNKKLELIGASEGFKKQIAATDAVSDGPFGYVGDTQDLQKRLSDARENLQDLSRGDLNRAERLTTSSPLDLNIQDQLTRDAFRSAVEKADADKASRILVSPGTGFGVDAQIRRRMKDIPINIDTAKEDLKQTGDMFGIGYTPLGLNQLFPALGLQSREFGVDPVTGKYDQDRGLQDYTNYLRTLRFADTFRDEKAGGGIAKLAGVNSGPPPSSGPNSQGLQGLMKRVRNR